MQGDIYHLLTSAKRNKTGWNPTGPYAPLPSIYKPLESLGAVSPPYRPLSSPVFAPGKREMSVEGSYRILGKVPHALFQSPALKTPNTLSGPYKNVPSIYKPLESSKMPGVPYAPGTDGFKALSRMERDGIKIKNTGEIDNS